MGDIADMMINGDLCETCGEYLGDGDGYTRKCAACARDEGSEKVACPTCGKRVKATGLRDHTRMVHGGRA